MRPGKAIVVLSEECDECELELCDETCPDLDLVVRIIRMDADVVKFI